MVGYPAKVGEREACAAGVQLPISTKNSIIVCRKLRNMELEKAKKFLRDLIDKKVDINGKHYTKTAIHILKILESAEKNARYKGLEKLRIKVISAEKGPSIHRRKRRSSFGSKLKNTHIKVILEEIK